MSNRIVLNGISYHGKGAIQEIPGIVKAQGKTILLVLHDLAKALTISDKLIVMESGAICFQGTPDECVQKNVLNKVFHTSLKTFSDAEGTYYLFEQVPYFSNVSFMLPIR